METLYEVYLEGNLNEYNRYLIKYKDQICEFYVIEYVDNYLKICLLYDGKKSYKWIIVDDLRNFIFIKEIIPTNDQIILS